MVREVARCVRAAVALQALAFEIEQRCLSVEAGDMALEVVKINLMQSILDLRRLNYRLNPQAERRTGDGK